MKLWHPKHAMGAASPTKSPLPVPIGGRVTLKPNCNTTNNLVFATRNNRIGSDTANAPPIDDKLKDNTTHREYKPILNSRNKQKPNKLTSSNYDDNNVNNNNTNNSNSNHCSNKSLNGLPGTAVPAHEPITTPSAPKNSSCEDTYEVGIANEIRKLEQRFESDLEEDEKLWTADPVDSASISNQS